ncbi:MAG: hypothetical protein AAGU74_12930 [Bacillota bacterium]
MDELVNGYTHEMVNAAEIFGKRKDAEAVGSLKTCGILKRMCAPPRQPRSEG